MIFFNQQEPDDWDVLTGLMIITTTILLFCGGCSQKINTSVTKVEELIKSAPVVETELSENEPLNINFSDDSETASEGDNIYIVSTWETNRECLSRIANEMYGDALLWPKIYEANRDIIQDPDLIYPGQRLIIP